MINFILAWHKLTCPMGRFSAPRMIGRNTGMASNFWSSESGSLSTVISLTTTISCFTPDNGRDWSFGCWALAFEVNRGEARGVSKHKQDAIFQWNTAEGWKWIFFYFIHHPRKVWSEFHRQLQSYWRRYVHVWPNIWTNYKKSKTTVKLVLSNNLP